MYRRIVLASLCAAALGCATERADSDHAAKPAASSSMSANTNAPKKSAESWNFNATIIEACSCPMFCQCYFNSKPAGPGCCAKPDDPKAAERYCRFNNAFKVNKGSYAGTSLDGAKFWLAGDLGGDFSKGTMGWCVLSFDPSVSAAQRKGIQDILGRVYPVKWESFSLGKDMPIEWTASRDRAVAKLDGGKAAEVVLKKNQGMTDDPIVIHNLRYWGVPHNDGFVLMANEVEAYRASDKSFEFKGTNGFMITLNMNSSDA
jgi:hypothetical protein